MKDTPPIFLAEAKVVAVSALPVTAPVTLPSMFATNVATVYPAALKLTVVVGCVCKSLKSLHFPEESASLNIPEYKSCEPDVSYNP